MVFKVGNDYGSLKTGKVRYLLKTEDIARLFGVKPHTVRVWYCKGWLTDDISSLVKLIIKRGVLNDS